MKDNHWHVSIDTGGTFTDCIALSPKKKIQRLKILSSGVVRVSFTANEVAGTIKAEWPLKQSKNYSKGFIFRVNDKSYRILSYDFRTGRMELDKPLVPTATRVGEISTGEEVPVFALRLLTQTGLDESFPPCHMRLGSTRGTNALLEKKGARVALVTTRGFKDILLIGDQQRPNLFSLNIRRDPPLYTLVAEVSGRMDSMGQITEPPIESDFEKLLALLRKAKIQSVAIALMNSYRNPELEAVLRKRLTTEGFNFISCSSDLSTQIKILPRTQTAVVNAYLEPIIRSYVDNIANRLGQQFQFMTSAGGLVPASAFHPKDSLLSGPAGGVIGALHKAKLSGISRIITFDMGGTSTDVSLCNGRPELRFESSVGSHTILSPSIAIDTIAAGGGSICSFDGTRLEVGPESAGASPGPACYGAGGPLTLTDVNLLLGRLDESNFSIPISIEASERRLQEILKSVKKSNKQITREDLLSSFVAIANEKMAEAIRKVSIKKGHNPHDFGIVCFGGAGGQHACALASMLGVKKIVVPYDAGLLSAYGIGQSPLTRISEHLVLAPLTDVQGKIRSLAKRLISRNKATFRSEGFDDGKVRTSSVLLFARLKGQETSLELDITRSLHIRNKFVEKYRHLYGTVPPNRPLEVESIKVISVLSAAHPERAAMKPSGSTQETRKKAVYTMDGWRACMLYRWESMAAGTTLRGPALITSDNATLFIEKGWRFRLDKNQNAILWQSRAAKVQPTQIREAALELYINRFTAIANDMGTVLQRTSFSVNVKERLDFSCALLDPNGNLIVNAPHIPVHLGSLGVCVRAVKNHVLMKKGDVVITNHPAFGGSHLPDITLIKPVFVGTRLIGYVANRAHHAEVGGKKPGSMPVDATFLAEEGVIIPPTHIVRLGKPQWNRIEFRLREGPYPSRLVHENLADLNGALASLAAGEELLKQMCLDHGWKEVTSYMKRIHDLAASETKQLIRSLPDKKLSAVELLDDGSRLEVHIRKQSGHLAIDFSGTSGVHSGSLNATPAIVQSVVLYVLRLLINKPVPLNEGLLKHVSLQIPRGMLNPAFESDKTDPAVVGGNTEVSQRLTDTLLKAFGVVSCSQGTMNNLIFGNETFGFYETIGGGTGAGPDFEGTDAVHQHMTNTRITDAEIMEHRYPVCVERFEIRRGSGGSGLHRGGNGIRRELRFYASLAFNILSQHRIQSPYGLKGGGDGKTGRQYLLRSSGQRQKINGMDGGMLYPGDRLIIETPGGGGWGK